MSSLKRSSLLAASACLVLCGAAFAQGHAQPTQPPPGTYPGPEILPSAPGPDDKCRTQCMQEQNNCMMPCATAPGADAPENQKATMACVTKCSKKSTPCMKKCEQASGKKPAKKAKGSAR